LRGITHSPELKQFLAVGEQTVLASEDGKTWFSPTAQSDGGNFVVWAKDRYFTARYNSVGRSLDGVRWTASQLAPFGRAHWANGIAYDRNADRLVAAGGGHSSGRPTALFWYSQDGSSWDWITVGEDYGAYDYTFHDIIFSEGRLVAVGGRPISDTPSLNLLVVSPPNEELSSRSKDGLTPCHYGVSSGAGLFVIVGESGSIFTSQDLQQWESRDSGVTNTLRSVAFGQGLFVAVGEQGAILRSADGLNWAKDPSVVSHTLNRITHANGTFVAVGDNGTILQSSRPARFLDPRLLENGGFTFSIEANDWHAFRLEGSSDLVTWTRLIDFQDPEPVSSFSDESASDSRFRFYRIVVP
jgi:hypothetical protein